MTRVARRGLVTFFILACLSGCSPKAIAGHLNQDCDPAGWIAILKAWWNPVGFWSAQPPAIEEYVDGQVKAYRAHLVRRQAEAETAPLTQEKKRIEQAAREEEMRIYGIQPRPMPPEKQRALGEALAKVDELFKAFEEKQSREVATAIQWGEKCVAVSRAQVARARR